MLALNLLRVAFAWAVPAGLQQRFALETDSILAPPKDIRQDCARLTSNGIPQPVLVAFFAHEAPHLIQLGCTGLLNVHDHFVWIDTLVYRSHVAPSVATT